MSQRPLITVSVKIPLGQYEEVIRVAERENLVTKKGRLNMSEALRQLIALGLRSSAEGDAG